MVKVKINAGAEIDTLTREELRQELRLMTSDWMAEVTRGFKFRRFLALGPITAGAVSIVDGVDNTLGPGAGMVWSVTSISVAGLALNDSVDCLVNDKDPIGSIARVAGTGQYPTIRFNSPDIVLQENDTLSFTASGLVSTASQLQVFGRCIEIPRVLSYKLVS